MTLSKISKKVVMSHPFPYMNLRPLFLITSHDEQYVKSASTQDKQYVKSASTQDEQYVKSASTQDKQYLKSTSLLTLSIISIFDLVTSICGYTLLVMWQWCLGRYYCARTLILSLLSMLLYCIKNFIPGTCFSILSKWYNYEKKV